MNRLRQLGCFGFAALAGALSVVGQAADGAALQTERPLWGGPVGFPAATLVAEGVQTQEDGGRLVLDALAPALHRGVKFVLPDGGTDLARFRHVEAELTNRGPQPVVFTFWAMSGQGWGGVSTFPGGDPSGRETLAPGETRRFRIDLHARYSGPDVLTPAIDAAEVRWLELVFEHGAKPLTVEVGEIRAVGEGLPRSASMEQRYRVPEVERGEPAPGRRVERALPGWSATQVRHVLTLPREWQPGGRYPVIIEFTGNRFYHKFCYSTGRTADGKLAAGLARGEKFIVLNLPFVSEDGQREQIDGFGDVARGVDYALAALEEVFVRFGGDRRAVFFTGFSRGDYAANRLALHDDRIAAVWRGFLTTRHPGAAWDPKAGDGWRKVGLGWNERAARMGGAGWFYEPAGLGAEVHADVEFLEDRPSTVATRRWLYAQVTAARVGR